MIESILVRRLSAITMFVALATAALALSLGAPRVAGGLAAGAFLGLLPIVFWAYVGAFLLPRQHHDEARRHLIGRDGNRAKSDPPSPLAFGVMSLAKLLLYAAALAFLIGGNLVDPLAFAGALLAPSLLMAAMLSARRAGAAR
jgi:hypothetical protein